MRPGKGFVEFSVEGKLYHMVASGNKNSCNCTLLQPQALEPQAPSCKHIIFLVAWKQNAHIFGRHLHATRQQASTTPGRNFALFHPLFLSPFLVPLFLPYCCHSSFLEFLRNMFCGVLWTHQKIGQDPDQGCTWKCHQTHQNRCRRWSSCRNCKTKEHTNPE